MTYGIQTWGNSTSITKLDVLQKRIIRLINKKRYRRHTEPIFKSESILKISDLYKLHVSLFMFDLQNGSLQISFKTYIQQSESATDNTIYTIQHGRLKKERPRTTFSPKLPNHNFTIIWNNISENIRNAVNRRQFKFMLHDYYTDQYESCVISTTVVPVMNGHPRDQVKVSVHDRWPLVRGTEGRAGGGAKCNTGYSLHENILNTLVQSYD